MVDLQRILWFKFLENVTLWEGIFRFLWFWDQFETNIWICILLRDEKGTSMAHTYPSPLLSKCTPGKSRKNFENFFENKDRIRTIWGWKCWQNKNSWASTKVCLFLQKRVLIKTSTVLSACPIKPGYSSHVYLVLVLLFA